MLISFKIIELPRSEAPHKRNQTQKPQQQRDWDQRAEDGHARYPFLQAFRITRIDESDIAAAATSGVTSPASAMGMAIAL